MDQICSFSSNMCFNNLGEYFVVGVDVEQYDAHNPEKYLTGIFSKKSDPILEKAFRSFFSVVPTSPKGFKNFSDKVNEYVEKPPFKYTNPLAPVGGLRQVFKNECFPKLYYSKTIK